MFCASTLERFQHQFHPGRVIGLQASVQTDKCGAEPRPAIHLGQHARELGVRSGCLNIQVAGEMLVVETVARTRRAHFGRVYQAFDTAAVNVGSEAGGKTGNAEQNQPMICIPGEARVPDTWS